MYDYDFTRQFQGDVLVENINLSRATIREANIFKERVFGAILMGQLKIVIDLSECSFIDSTFLGALVLIMKRITNKGGELKIVQPKPNALELINQIGLFRVFNIYYSVDEAVRSFDAEAWAVQ